MANTTNESVKPGAPAPKGGRRWLRILMFSALGVVLLLVIAFFVVTSEGFFKGVILPKVSKAMNAEVTVSGASIGLSQVSLRDLKVQTTGPEPLVTAQLARVRYGLWSIIGGTIKVDEVVLQSPTIQLVENADGSSNLDPLTKKPDQTGQAQPQKPAEPSKPAEPEKKAEPSKPLKVAIKKVELSNATFRQVKNYSGGARDLTSVSGFNLTVTDVANGQTGQMNLSANLAMDNNPPGGTNSSLQGNVAGNFTFALTPDLQPGSVKGSTRLVIDKAGGSLSDAANLAAVLNCDTTPTDIKELALRFQKAGAPLAEILASGPFNMARTEGRLTVQILGINRQVLDLAGAKSGLAFGSTLINSTNVVTLTNQGKLITLAGQLNADKFSVTRTNQTTPPLDLKAVYNVTVDQLGKSALLQEFAANGVQNQRSVLTADLSNPMKVAWGGNAPAAGDATLNLKVNGLDFADWKPFLGSVAPAGKLNVDAKLLSQQSGNLLTLDLSSQLEGLTAIIASNPVSQLSAKLLTKAQVSSKPKKIVINDTQAQLAQQGQPVLNLSASGFIDQEKTNSDLNVTLQSSLPRLVQMVPQTNMAITSGNLGLKAHVLQNPAGQTVTADLALTNLTAKLGESALANYAIISVLDVAATDTQVQIRKLNAQLQGGGKPGGTLDASGNVDFVKKGETKALQAAKLSFKLADLNQNVLQPFLQPSFGDNKLESVLVNGAGNVNYVPEGASAVKADLAVTKLSVKNPTNTAPSAPLEARVQLDGSLAKEVLDLRSLLLALTPTARAKNELLLAGKVDRSDTNAMQGGLKLSAEALDLTPYFDLLGQKSAQAAPATAAKASATSPASGPTPGGAPAPVPATPAQPGAAAQKPLPFRNFAFDANIGHVYLREIDLASLQSSIKLDANRVQVQPLQLTLNGSPVKSAVDLGLGGSGPKYDVSFAMEKLQVQPLIDSFIPEKKGLYKGEIFSNAKVQGVGTEGTSLQKTLAGQVQFSLTNANINIMDPLLQKYLGKYLAPLTRFLAPVANKIKVPGILESPLEEVSFSAQMGQGQIKVANANLANSLFYMTTGGNMPIADALTNSPFQNWPVNFYLSRGVMDKIGMVPAGTPANAKYAKFPDFLAITGTLGKPDPKFDEMALVRSGAATALNKIPGLDQGTRNLIQGFLQPGTSPGPGGTTGTNTTGGSLMQGLGKFLPGTHPAGTNAAPGTKTNAAATGGGILQGLGKLLPGATNAPPATNQPATNPAPRPSLFDLIPRR